MAFMIKRCEKRNAFTFCLPVIHTLSTTLHTKSQAGLRGYAFVAY